MIIQKFKTFTKRFKPIVDTFTGTMSVFVFKIIGALALFFAHVVISRVYGTVSFGIFNLLFSLIMFLAIFTRMGLDIYIVRIVPGLSQKGEFLGFMFRVIKYVFFSTIFTLLVMSLFLESIDKYIFKNSDSMKYLINLLWVLFPFSFYVIFSEVFRAFKKMAYYSFFRHSLQNIMFLGFLIIIWCFSLSVDVIFLYYIMIAISFCIIIFVLYSFLKRKGYFDSSMDRYELPIIKNSYPMLMTSIMMYLMGHVDTFMISYFMNEYYVGLYSAALRLSLLIGFFLMSINSYIAPRIAESYSQGDTNSIKKIYNSSIIIIGFATIPALMLLFIFPEFFLGLFGKDFIKAKVVLWVVISGMSVNALIGPVGYVLNMTDNQHVVFKVIFLSMCVNIITNYFLIPQYGILGAAIATLISILIWKVTLFIIMKRRIWR